jgi:hypothetical protein
VWVENEQGGATYRTFFDRTARQALSQHDSAVLIDGIREEL